MKVERRSLLELPQTRACQLIMQLYFVWTATTITVTTECWHHLYNTTSTTYLLVTERLLAAW